MKKLSPFIAIILCVTFLISCTKNMQQTDNQNLAGKVTPDVPYCGMNSHWDFYLRKCVDNCPTGYHNDSITGACVVDAGGGGVPLIVSYAGVDITYYPGNHTLSFNNSSDVNTVLNQLDSDYEQYNTTYENQYPNATDLQLDSLDSVNNFDQLRTYENFEENFPGYISERSIFDNNETTWLNNNMTGPDPDSLDYTVDNSENAICNNNYQFIIAGTTYQWTSTGLITVGGLQSPIVNSPDGITGSCFTNYRIAHYFPTNYTTRRCKLKVAINDCLIRGSAKTKAKSFRKKSNGHWVHSRIGLQVNIAGTDFMGSNCSPLLNINKTKGYKTRVELKVVDREASGASWTESGQMQGTFYTHYSGITGNIIL